VLIGLDLCRALAAVHAAGLVHGDVKTTNVMRERGGRIILMDFGAGSEIASGRAQTNAVGTPIVSGAGAAEWRAPVAASDI